MNDDLHKLQETGRKIDEAIRAQESERSHHPENFVNPDAKVGPEFKPARRRDHCPQCETGLLKHELYETENGKNRKSRRVCESCGYMSAGNGAPNNTVEGDDAAD